MDNYTYLATEMSKYINNKQRNYARAYRWLKAKRFFALNIMAFSFQYLCIYHLKSFLPLYPLYPAMGIAFTVIAILGENAILGLLLGGMCAYYLKGYSLTYIFLYSTADIVCAYVGAYLCRNVFMSDIPKHATIPLWMRFIRINAFVAGLSSLLRITAIVLSEMKFPKLSTLFYCYIDLWLADLSAIILFYAFLSTWLSVYMSREKIVTNKIPLYSIIIFILFAISAILAMKKLALIYVLAASMLLSLAVAYRYGMIIATLVMYIANMLYLTYFMLHQPYYLTWLGIGGYTLVPSVLFIFTVAVIFISNSRHS